MPLTQREVLQIGLLILCVPAQYLLSRNFGSKEARSQAVLNLVNEIQHFHGSWLQYEPWKKWCLGLLAWLKRDSPSPAEPFKKFYSKDESPALEVFSYREEKGYFATSNQVRKLRPMYLRFRVGQVVQHRTLGYRGVIIGWDLYAKAPESWILRNHGINKITPKWPHFAILIDVKDQSEPHTAYVVQEELELLKNTQIENPFMQEFFEYYDGAQYIPRSHLRARYPND